METGSFHSSSSYQPTIDDAEQSLLRGFYREALHVSNDLLREAANSSTESIETDSETMSGYELSFMFRGERVPILVIQSSKASERDRTVAVALQSWHSLFRRASSDCERERGFPHLQTTFESLDLGVSVEVAGMIVQFLSNMNLRQASLSLAVDLVQLFEGMDKAISLACVWEILLCQLLPYSKSETIALGLLRALETTTNIDASETSDDNSSYVSKPPEESTLNQLEEIPTFDSEETPYSISSDSDLVSFIARWKYCEKVNVGVLVATIKFASDSPTEASLCISALKQLRDEVVTDGDNEGSIDVKALPCQLTPVPSNDQSSRELLKGAASRLLTAFRDALLCPWQSDSVMDQERIRLRRHVVIATLSFWIVFRQRKMAAHVGRRFILTLAQPFLEVVQALMPSH